MRRPHTAAFYALTVLLVSPVVTRADVVQDWNAIMQSTVTGQTPMAAARFAAITQLAVFEAVNAITRDYKPYLGTIFAPTGASPEAAAVAAAHTVLKNYFPASMANLDASRAASLAMIPEGPGKSAGIAVGEAAAAAMIAARTNDGSETSEIYMPDSTNPGQYQRTPACTAGGTFLHWRYLTPFSIRSGDQFRLDPPPALTSMTYTRDYNEVKEVGGANSTRRPQDRTNVARFYGSTPPYAVWNTVARQLSASTGNSLSENARAFALLNMAISDAHVAVFDTKYHYPFWRPETAIGAATMDGNDRTEPDPNFTPLLVTPCYPSYPSNHGTASNAGREVLERIFSDRRPSITLTNTAVPGVTLNYTSLQKITDDIADARVYAGIHFRFDQEAGAELGRRVGGYVYRNTLGRARCDCEAPR
jgi:hypothetical protein